MASSAADNEKKHVVRKLLSILKSIKAFLIRKILSFNLFTGSVRHEQKRNAQP